MSLKKEKYGELKFLGSGGSYGSSEQFAQSNEILRDGLEAALRIRGHKSASDCSRVLAALKHSDDLSDSKTNRKIRQILLDAAEGCFGNTEKSKICKEYNILSKSRENQKC